MDLDKIEEAATRHAGDINWPGAAIAYETHVTPNDVVEMVGLIRKQEAALNASPACVDPVVETNVALLRSRSAVGIEKYGTTVAGNNLPLRAWLNHALEETLDNANYLQRAMQEIDAAPAPATPAASVDTAQYAAGRQQGRAEALAILMELDPEGGIEAYTGWSAPVGPDDEGSAYWDTEKLRELFAADVALEDMMDKAMAEYWQGIGMQDEAEHAKNFAANMHSSDKVRDVLAKAGEFDLMGQLCAAAPQQHAQATWIDASVTKPTEGDLVLICGVIPSDVESFRGLKGWRTCASFRDGDFLDANGCTMNSATHWMPLPNSAHDGASQQPAAAPAATHVTPQEAAAAGIECGDTACGGCNAGESWCMHAPSPVQREVKS